MLEVVTPSRAALAHKSDKWSVMSLFKSHRYEQPVTIDGLEAQLNQYGDSARRYYKLEQKLEAILSERRQKLRRGPGIFIGDPALAHYPYLSIEKGLRLAIKTWEESYFKRVKWQNWWSEVVGAATFKIEVQEFATPSDNRSDAKSTR